MLQLFENIALNKWKTIKHNVTWYSENQVGIKRFNN